jgi:Cu(I)/Ag(I) efflux system protein CusF
MKFLSTFLLAFVAGTALAGTHLTEAEVRKVDPANGKITLKHGDIKNLDMPPMTMVFGVKDKALLAGVKQGDRIRFSAEKDGAQYVVTAIQKDK